MRLMISRFTMDSNFRAKKWCSPGALWMGERVEKGGKGEGRGKEGGIKEQWRSKLGMKLNHHFPDLRKVDK